MRSNEYENERLDGMKEYQRLADEQARVDEKLKDIQDNARLASHIPLSTEAVNPTKQHSMKCPMLYGSECKCDGYHTFDELYDHRITLFIALCRLSSKHSFRSRLHADGSSFEGWFIAGIDDPSSKQITYHLPLSRWDETNFMATYDRAPEWDGHTPEDVIERLKQL